MNAPSNDRHLLRVRDGHEARVSYVELFFDLIYVFAVTQISHRLLEDLSVNGALEALVLWFAVWLGWQYTAWVTNWFDPETIPVRLMLLTIMLVGLVMASAIPQAFGERGLIFACCYAAIQLGRTLFVLTRLGAAHALTPNFRRILGWLTISALFWVAGGLQQGHTRLLLWAVAVLCEYVSPMTGFRLPGLGRSRSEDWTIEGGHLAERCQLFMIVALGESILVTGATLSQNTHWDTDILLAMLAAFVGSVAMWWVYFDTSSKDGSHAIAHAEDPGRIGAYFHYIHVTMVAGVIVSAVGNELVIAHPHGHLDLKEIVVLLAGPVIYLLGNALYKRVVYGRMPLSHVAGVVALLALAALGPVANLLILGALTTVVLVGVAVWEGCERRLPAV